MLRVIHLTRPSILVRDKPHPLDRDHKGSVENKSVVTSLKGLGGKTN
jgi:hypothetical protein